MSNENLANNSGQGADTVVPDCVAKHFNWGAFGLNWIWGIFNKTYITFVIFATVLICWIPFVGVLAALGLSIWFGIKGNEWAWRNKHFESVEKFHEYQKKWAFWGILMLVLSVISTLLFIILLAGILAATYTVPN